MVAARVVAREAPREVEPEGTSVEATDREVVRAEAGSSHLEAREGEAEMAAEERWEAVVTGSAILAEERAVVGAEEETAEVGAVGRVA